MEYNIMNHNPQNQIKNLLTSFYESFIYLFIKKNCLKFDGMDFPVECDVSLGPGEQKGRKFTSLKPSEEKV